MVKIRIWRNLHTTSQDLVVLCKQILLERSKIDFFNGTSAIVRDNINHRREVPNAAILGAVFIWCSSAMSRPPHPTLTTSNSNHHQRTESDVARSQRQQQDQPYGRMTNILTKTLVSSGSVSSRLQPGYHLARQPGLLPISYMSCRSWTYSQYSERYIKSAYEAPIL